MPTPRLSSPFDDAPLDEIALANAPLEMVVAQLRYGQLAALTGDDGQARAERVASRLQGMFPFFKREPGFQLVVQVAAGKQEIEKQPTSAQTWRLLSADRAIQLSFGPTFISLGTRDYPGRTAFCSLLQEVLGHIAEVFQPPMIDRVGLRYINRVTVPEVLSDLGRFVHSEVLGTAGVSLPPGVAIAHSLAETLFVNDSQGLKATWGKIPAGGQIDPNMPPSSQESWLLDLDAFTRAPAPYDAVKITGQTRNLADLAYRCFRWAVRQEFLDRFQDPA